MAAMPPCVIVVRAFLCYRKPEALSQKKIRIHAESAAILGGEEKHYRRGNVFRHRNRYRRSQVVAGDKAGGHPPRPPLTRGGHPPASPPEKPF